MKTPFVSILLVGYNSKADLNTCFSSLRKITYPKTKYEVIFIDNNSQDDSVVYLRRRFKWVKLLSLDKNYGVATAFNRGIKVSRGEYVVILNPDTEVEKKWLIELVKAMESDDKIGACGSKLLYYDDRDKINAIGGFWSILGFSGSLGEGDDKDTYTETKEVFFPSGTSMIVRKELLSSLGGYDEDYFMYVEETDLAWKLWNLGYRVMSVPSSIVYHKVSASVKKGSGGFKSMVYYHTTKNRLSTIIKNAAFFDIVWMLPLSLIAHIFQAFVFLVRWRVGSFFAVFKGIFWMFTNLFGIVKKRGVSVHGNKANKLMLGPLESIKIFINKFKKHF